MLLWRTYIAGNIEVLRSSGTVPTFGLTVTKFRVSRQIFIKLRNVEFHENPSSWIRSDTCERTDGHGKHNIRYILQPTKCTFN